MWCSGPGWTYSGINPRRRHKRIRKTCIRRQLVRKERRLRGFDHPDRTVGMDLVTRQSREVFEYRFVHEAAAAAPLVASRYARVDSMMSAGRDTLQVIDKETLEIVGQVRPEPGKALAHVEFTRGGRYVLASLWEKDGAIIVFDAQTLKEVKRIPMNIPVGKYNVYNKITRSEGTSH